MLRLKKCNILFILFLISGGKCVESDLFYKYISKDDNSSSSGTECNTQKLAFIKGLLKQESWALKSKEFQHLPLQAIRDLFKLF